MIRSVEFSKFRSKSNLEELMAQVQFQVTITITPVTPPPLTATQPTVSLPAAQVGSTVSDSVASNVTGGVPPYTFSVSQGQLPPGLSMDQSGNITGTPSSAGSFSFQVTAADSGS